MTKLKCILCIMFSSNISWWQYFKPFCCRRTPRICAWMLHDIRTDKCVMLEKSWRVKKIELQSPSISSVLTPSFLKLGDNSEEMSHLMTVYVNEAGNDMKYSWHLSTLQWYVVSTENVYSYNWHCTIFYCSTIHDSILTGLI